MSGILRKWRSVSELRVSGCHGCCCCSSWAPHHDFALWNANSAQNGIFFSLPSQSHHWNLFKMRARDKRKKKSRDFCTLHRSKGRHFWSGLKRRQSWVMCVHVSRILNSKHGLTQKSVMINNWASGPRARLKLIRLEIALLYWSPEMQEKSLRKKFLLEIKFPASIDEKQMH